MTSNHQNRWLNYGLVVLVALLVAGLLYYTSEQFERIKTTVNRGYTQEAIQNPFLAAQQYLEKRSISSSTAIDITQVLDEIKPKDALLLLNTRLVPEVHQQQLIDWVESGGHLIITAHNLWDEEYQESGDPFLDNLGVRLYNDLEEEVERIGKAATESLNKLAEESKTPEENEWEEVLEPELNQDADQTTEADQCTAWGYARLEYIFYDEHLPPLQIQFGSYTHLFDVSGDTITPEYYQRNQMLQYPIGQGMITTVTSHHMWNNQSIGWFDHAYYLWLLVQNANNVWFIFDRSSDSLLTLITNRLLEPFVAGLLLLALYLWHRAKRFGPITPEPEKSRRSLMEHLIANAHFQWRHQQIEPLIQKQREEIKNHFQTRHGSHHDQDYVLTTLAKSSQLTPEQVRWALTSDTPEKEQEYTQLIRLLQRLRNAV